MKAVSIALLSAFALVGAAVAADAPAKAAPLFADPVLATGRGFEIRRSQLDEAIVGFKANAAARGERVLVPPAELDAKLLDKLITVEVLKRRATAEDRAKATNSVDKLMATMQGGVASPATFARQLQSLGTTPERLREQLTDQVLAENVVDRELRAPIVITAGQAKKFYDENAAGFRSPEMVRVSHILFSTRSPETGAPLAGDAILAKRATADKVLARAKAGEDFARLVKEFSDDTASRDTGGEYTLARGQMAPEFEAAAFSLAPGRISDIVITFHGYHIIKGLERLPPKPLELAKVEDRIKDALRTLESDKQMPAYLERVRKEAGVKILADAPK